MNIHYSSAQFIWKIADWIYPPICAGCGASGFRLCPKCFSEIKMLRGSYCLSCGKSLPADKRICSNCINNANYCTDVCSWAEYSGTLREAIHKFKYKQDIGLGDFFAPFLITMLETKKWSVDIVIPVPISKKRKKDRGYNQAELLSVPISRYLRILHSNSLLTRIKETESQVQLNAEDRFRNMEGAFYGNPAKLKSRRILLVDDIITTGATMNHCAKALFEAGADKVYGLSIAKTIRSCDL